MELKETGFYTSFDNFSIFFGSFQMNDMQIPPPSSKVAKLDFCYKKIRNLLKSRKKQFSVFYFFEIWSILCSNS